MRPAITPSRRRMEGSLIRSWKRSLRDSRRQWCDDTDDLDRDESARHLQLAESAFDRSLRRGVGDPVSDLIARLVGVGRGETGHADAIIEVTPPFVELRE